MKFSRLWQVVYLGLVSGWCLSLPGCQETSAPRERPVLLASSTPRQGGTYRKPLKEEPSTLDPAFLTETYATTVAQQIFDGLVQFDQDLNIVPSLAHSWVASRDGLRWTFSLHKGVLFHHGREMTADDFVYAFTRLLHPQTASPRAWLLNRIQGARRFMSGSASSVTGLRALDPYTLQITLEQPYAPFISLLGMPQTTVIPREEVERLGAEFGRQPVGTGPFRFVQWHRGKEIVLEANTSYIAGRPLLDQLVYRIRPNHQAILAEFEQGFLEDASLTERPRSAGAAEPAFQFLRKPLLATLFFLMNTQSPPLNDRRVRQAINHAINRQLVNASVRHNQHMQARGILPEGMPGYNPEALDYPYDPSRAKQLLAEAGYPGGHGLAPIELWTSSRTVTAVLESEAVQQDLARVGIQVKLQTAPSWQHFKTEILGKRPGAMYRYAWYADFPDPDNVLYPLFHSQSADNYTHYKNAEVDRLLEATRSESDYLRRMQTYRQIEALIMADAPTVNLVYYTFGYLFQPYVRGIELNALGERHIPMKKIWLDVTHRVAPTLSPHP
ncbi:MAG: ABC transporter substrate-binding protein [Candidatus Tectimicrobiota bacterium]